MARKTAVLTIMFADISGSTRLYEALGDEAARELTGQCLALMAECVASHQGKVVKTIGDELMCVFAMPERAVNAAMAMQEAVTDELPRRNSETPPGMSIRVGLHHGPIIAEHGDVFGDAVNLAARMAAMAKGGQIITTEETVALLPNVLQHDTRHVDRTPVKGKSEEIDVFEVVWQPEDVTRIATSVVRRAPEPPQVNLILHYRGERRSIRPGSPPFVLGRGQKADMVVEDSMASREHARIEVRRGKYFIADQSTNGTYVESDGVVAYLRREEMQISGQGRIALGRAPSEATELVLFAVV